jgi:hypothetical protein
MKKTGAIALGMVAATPVAPSQVSAQSGEGRQSLFRCQLRNGKTVEVSSQGGNIFYDYGTGRRRELLLRGSARSGTVHFMRQRYAGIEQQLRFTNGNTHHIVYHMEGNPQVGAHAVSGLVVMQGRRRVADHDCRRYTEFRGSFALDSLPEDSETYTAM